MSASVPVIWMNVTTSANWRRPPVGIVRVEQSLCIELAKLYGERFKQCVWQEGQFIEWVPQPVNQENSLHSSNMVHESINLSQKFQPIFPLLSRPQALAAVAQGVLSLVPDKVRPFVNRLFYKLRPHIARIVFTNSSLKIFTRRKIKNLTSVNSSSCIASREKEYSKTFNSGDVLISLGLDWNQNFYKEFYHMRKQQGIRVVTCCYDLIPVIYPQYCVGEVAGIFTSYFLDVADASDLVLCISKQTEKDFLEMLARTGGATPMTHVFPLGDNVPLMNMEKISAVVKNICKEPFILFVSTIERRKNHEVLYRAYHLLCSEGKRSQLPKLVFVGMQGWGVGDLLNDIELDPLTCDMIVKLNHVTDAELRSLYETAKFCVFPSLYEGWGLPVGEALALGKAVLSSDRGSLPEVGGNLAHYVDPWSPRAWADEIYKMTTNDAWRTEWEQKTKSEYRMRTWAGAAGSIQEAVDTMLNFVDSSSTDMQITP